MPTKKRLSAMSFDEVSLVGRGDNPTAEVVIAKSEEKITDKEEGSDTLVSAQQEDGMDNEQTGALEADLSDELVEYIEALESVVEDQAVVLKSAGITFDEDGNVYGLPQEDLSKSENDGEEDLIKSHPAFVEMQERVETAEMLAKSASDELYRQEMVVKAEQMPMISDDREHFVNVLSELYETDADLAVEVEKLLRTANEQIAKGNLFTEIGKSGAMHTVSQSVESAAAEIAKSEGLTKEAALAAAFERNPELYNQHLTEGI